MLFRSAVRELKKYFDQPIKFEKNNLVAVMLIFAERYVLDVGFLHNIIQKLTFQGINIWEINSTYTELTLLVETEMAKLAFDTLFEGFMKSTT